MPSSLAALGVTEADVPRVVAEALPSLPERPRRLAPGD